ncbi:MAG: hypothetical protein LCH31_06460 [Actinobacteria bacterium]|nr:hypothetical protein [Actinomycetota bacterium]
MDLLPKKKTATPKIVSGGVPRVNLLPREVIAKREQSGMIKSWGVRVAATAVIVAVGVLGMFAWQAVTTLRLGATQAEGTSLLTQIGSKSEIQQLINTESSLGSFEKKALATDFGWVESLQRLLAKFPEGSTLCSFDLTGGAAPAGDPETQVGLSGVFTMCGSAASVISYLRDATSVDGVLAVTIVDSTYDQTLGLYTHTIAVQFDQTIYTGAEKKKSDAAEAPAEAPPAEEPEEEAAATPEPGATPEGDDTQTSATTPATEEAAA